MKIISLLLARGCDQLETDLNCIKLPQTRDLLFARGRDRLGITLLESARICHRSLLLARGRDRLEMRTALRFALGMPCEVSYSLGDAIN